MSIPDGMNGMKMVWMVQIWYGWYFRGLAGTLIEILVLRITP